MSDNGPELTGFIGLGTMGLPMARNLLGAGRQVLAWNRTASKTSKLLSEGAVAAVDVAAVFRAAGQVVLMLPDSAAVDEVLGRHSTSFDRLVRGRTVIQAGTLSPDYSLRLANDVVSAGGRHVEAPVSGSRGPAEAGQLVALVAGDPAVVDSVRPVVDAMCSSTVNCGPVPNALNMKLASNIYLLAMVTGLAKAMTYGATRGLDLEQFASALSAGPLPSALLRARARRMVDRDFTVDASVSIALQSQELIRDGDDRQPGLLPLLTVCRGLFKEAAQMGFADADIAAVLSAVEGRSNDPPTRVPGPQRLGRANLLG